MDAVRDLVRQRLLALGLSMSDASKRLGRNHAYMQQFLERGIPATLPEAVRADLAILLSVEESDLRTKAPIIRKTTDTRKLTIPTLTPTVDSRKMPVLGMAEAGPDGAYEWNGQVIEYIDPPPFLTSTVDSYAVYVSGSSMSPRYEPGELLYIHPGRPVTPGSYVLIQVRNGSDTPKAFLKRMVKRTGSKIILEQLNPHKTIELDAADVISVHRIIGSGEP